MIIDSRLTRKDYIKLSCLIILHRWTFYVILLFLALFFLISWPDIFIATACLVIVLFYYIFPVFHMGLSSKNRNFFLQKRCVVSDEGLSITSEISQSSAKWDAFIKWQDIDGFYILYSSRLTFMVIPKSEMSPEDISSFKALLKSKIKT